MRVEQQSLIPGMQRAEEADHCSEMACIAGHLEQSVSEFSIAHRRTSQSPVLFLPRCAWH
jgi:hypothetical protein